MVKKSIIGRNPEHQQLTAIWYSDYKFTPAAAGNIID